MTETTPSETPRIANTITESEAQTLKSRQTKLPERGLSLSGPPTSSLTAPTAPETQPPTRPISLYWRRLTSRYCGSAVFLTVTTNERDRTYVFLGLLG